MNTMNLCLLGFGNVNRTLVELLQHKEAELRERHGIEWRITGVASRRIGWQVNASGFDVAELLRAPISNPFTGSRGEERRHYNPSLDASQPAVVFEAPSPNTQPVQPPIH